MATGNNFLGSEYIRAIREHYPEIIDGKAIDSIDSQLHIGFIKHWSELPEVVGIDSTNRFQRFEQRSFSMLRNAWTTCADTSMEGLRRLGASASYKGLVHLKPPCDIVLYASLIWELRPATIIEFGALQGGSGLWLADQVEICGLQAEVHSFELLHNCIHPSASHKRLHFHHANLHDMDSLDAAMFQAFPHPWLVIDDAHANLDKLMPFVGSMLVTGDYYVVEDVLLNPTLETIFAWSNFCDRMHLLVDSKYTDAFGYNVTCSPNGWLRKI
jgi:cephalosporin hydroxylase